MSPERLDRLVALLTEFDPLELVRGGAPEDEYEPEARTTLPRLTAVESFEDVRHVVHEEFIRWFGASVAEDADLYELVSRAIWEWWCKTQVASP